MGATLETWLEHNHLLAVDVFGQGVAIELEEKDGWASAKVWSKDGLTVHMTMRARTKLELLKDLSDELTASKVQRDDNSGDWA